MSEGTLPDVTVPDQNGDPVRIYDNLPAIIFFYPKAMTPGCTAEACDFRDRLAPLAEAGYSLFGASPDKPAANAKFVEKERLTYPLLSDEDHSLAEALGAWGIKKNYGKEYEGLIRSTFVVEAGGEISHAFRNVRAKGHAERVVKALVES